MLPIWNKQREKVFLDRYALKDKNGNPIEKKPEEMFKRVAKAIAQNEKEESMFYEAIKDWKFIPGGRILAGAGTGKEVTYFNCFVIPVESNNPKKGNDSRAAIMDTIAKMLEINSRGGGVGINWSTLRPRGAYVKGVGGISSGAVSWMLAANEVATQVEQGGSRRAALMFMLWDWHPDIEEFIKIKKDLSKMQQANLSVAVSDDFMEAVYQDKIWKLEFPDTNYPNYDTEWEGDIKEWKSKGYPTIVYKEIPARELWNMIVTAAWESAEPGVVFLERYNKFSNTYYISKIISTNPCGELGLEPYGVCNLGSINLVTFVENNKINYKDLEDTVEVAVRFLDNVLDSGAYVLEENKDMAQRIRKIGLGIMGLADALILMGVRYGSDEAIKLTEKIAATIRNAAYGASVKLAKEKGTFPEFVAEKYLKSQFIENLPKELKNEIKTFGIRNATLLTQAPTGTTSILTGVSSGIEPNFAKEYIRQDRTGTHTVRHWLADYPAFVSAHEVTPEEHVKMQAVLQKYVDSSISKTINLPSTATVDEIDNIYRLAYELGCKGITVYRDGSREGVLVTDTKPKEKAQITQRPPVLKGVTKRIETPLGRAYVTINFIDEKAFEVFVNIGRAGSDVAAFTEAIARLISLALRGGVAVEEITDQLIGIGGATAIGFGENRVMSVPDAIGKALRNGYQPQNNNGIKSNTTHVDICPSCGMATFVYTEGCKTCLNCGYSEC